MNVVTVYRINPALDAQAYETGERFDLDDPDQLRELKSKTWIGHRLIGPPLYGADLSELRFRDGEIDLSLYDCDLRGAILVGTRVERNLVRCDLRNASLPGTRLQDAVDCRFDGADQRNTTFGQNLSGSTGLPHAQPWPALLADHLTADDFGLLFYKATGGTSYASPYHWRQPDYGVVWDEGGVCPERRILCGSGVNIAISEDWCRENYPESDVWRVRVPWAYVPTIVWPHGSDGKVRCALIEFVEQVYDYAEETPTYYCRSCGDTEVEEEGDECVECGTHYCSECGDRVVEDEGDLCWYCEEEQAERERLEQEAEDEEEPQTLLEHLAHEDKPAPEPPLPTLDNHDPRQQVLLTSYRSVI